ncbi:MAG: glycosyltransferase [Nitrospirae bacterium]|nr:glycosyltransferase [Nitrospirota bacterium]
MKKPLRIIQIIASHKWTGPAEGVIRLTAGLKQRGHEVWLLCAGHEPRLLQEKAEAEGLRPVEILSLRPKFKPGSVLVDPVRLASFIREVRPDILHAHLSHDHMIAAAARLLVAPKTSLVRTIHHRDSLRPRLFRSWFFRSMTEGFITLCEKDRRQLKELYRMNAKPIEVIRGAVDTTRFRPDLEARLGRAEFGVKMTTPVVGMVARFQPHRRHEILLKAMVRLRKIFPMIRLLLVGRGEHQPVLERLVRELGLERCVIFTGYRDRDLPQIYAAMDVAVLLASGSDGSCRAVLEAMAVGRPVVGFPVGALPETIVEGVTGYLVPDGDAEKLADGLEALLSDRARMQSMGEAARKRVEAEFTEDIRLTKTEAFYFSLIGN